MLGKQMFYHIPICVCVCVCICMYLRTLFWNNISLYCPDWLWTCKLPPSPNALSRTLDFISSVSILSHDVEATSMLALVGQGEVSFQEDFSEPYVAHAYSPRAREEDCCKFEFDVNLVYIVNFKSCSASKWVLVSETAPCSLMETSLMLPIFFLFS